MLKWIKNLFSDSKEEKKEKINEKIVILSSEIASPDGDLRFRFQMVGGKRCDLVILCKSDYLYYSVYSETTVEGNTGRCYLKIGEDENFKIMTGRFSCSYPFLILTVKDVTLSDFLKNDFTKCRFMSITQFVDTKLDDRFNVRLRCAIKDMLDRNEVLTTNPTKDL